MHGHAGDIDETSQQTKSKLSAPTHTAMETERSAQRNKTKETNVQQFPLSLTFL